MSGDARDFNNMETRAAKFLLLQGKEPKEIHAILIEKFRGTCTIVSQRQKLGGPV